MVELVDTLDLKSNDHCGRAGSSPASSTNEKSQNFVLAFFVLRGFFDVKRLVSVTKKTVKPNRL